MSVAILDALKLLPKAQVVGSSSAATTHNGARGSAVAGNGAGPVERVEWSRATILNFIEDYRRQRVLWDPNTRGYHIKQMKCEALRHLSHKYGAGIRSIRSKIKSLRSSFHREHGKVISGRMRGVHYRPMWFAYDAIRFILDESKAGGAGGAGGAAGSKHAAAADVDADADADVDVNAAAAVAALSTAQQKLELQSVDGNSAAAASDTPTRQQQQQQQRNAEATTCTPIKLTSAAAAAAAAAVAAAPYLQCNGNSNNNSSDSNNNNQKLNSNNNNNSGGDDIVDINIGNGNEYLKFEHLLFGAAAAATATTTTTATATAASVGAAAAAAAVLPNDFGIQNDDFAAYFARAMAAAIAQMTAATAAAIEYDCNQQQQQEQQQQQQNCTDDEAECDELQSLTAPIKMQQQNLLHESAVAAVAAAAAATAGSDAANIAAAAQIMLNSGAGMTQALQALDYGQPADMRIKRSYSMSSTSAAEAEATAAHYDGYDELSEPQAKRQYLAEQQQHHHHHSSGQGQELLPLNYSTGRQSQRAATELRQLSAAGGALDECAIYGDYVGVTIRKLKSSKARTIVKHLINNILYEAELGKYDEGMPMPAMTQTLTLTPTPTPTTTSMSMSTPMPRKRKSTTLAWNGSTAH